MAIVRTQAAVDSPLDSQTEQRRKREEPSALDDDEVEPFDPGDDSDLGLDDDDEDIGLDTAVGFDDGSEEEDLDLDDLDDDENDEEGWEADSDEATEIPDSDLELESEEDEYGWTEDDDANQDDDFADDFDDEPESSGDDGGAEGLEDESEIDDLDLGDLPALDKDSEEEVGLPGLEGDELAGYGLLDEPQLEVAPGKVWKVLRPQATRITRISWPAEARTALVDGSFSERSIAAHNQTLFLAARGLYRLDAPDEVFVRLPLPAAEAQQLVVAEHEGAVQLLVNAGGQLFLSSNAGQSFAAQPAPDVTHAGFTHSAAGTRVWWRSADGVIGSDGPIEPAHDSALLLDADGGRSIAWLSRFEQLRVTVSADGGRTFASWPVPNAIASGDLTSLRLETCGDALLLSAAGTLLVGEHNGELAEIAEGAREPATIADEEGEPFAYACLEHQAEWLLLRCSARAEQASPLVIATLGKELGEPLGLAVGYSEGGMLSVFVACQEGVWRIEASLDGEELA